jgi:uncharacterized protein (DUF433 family)
MELLERITVEADKCGGRPCIRGTRIRVTDILGSLAGGATHEEINLQIRDTNTEAIGFYSALGYERDEVVSMGKRLGTDRTDA